MNVTAKASPQFKIGSSVREKYYLADKYKYELPPPNIYNPNIDKIKNKSPATGLGYGERAAMSRTFMSPGPGAYKAASSIGEGPTYVLGARLNDSFESKKAKELPSPVHYNPKFEVLSKTQSVFSIGRSIREDPSGNRKFHVPGPGTYQSKYKIEIKLLYR